MGSKFVTTPVMQSQVEDAPPVEVAINDLFPQVNNLAELLDPISMKRREDEMVLTKQRTLLGMDR